MNSRHVLVARAMAALLTIASLLGSMAAPVGAATPVGATTRAGASGPATTPPAAAALTDFGQPFHFLPPIGVESGDPSKFDGSLLDSLIVSICRVGNAGCTVEKTLTSKSSLAERLRIGQTNAKDSYYLGNWDTSKVNLGQSTFRVSVTIDRLVLGSVDLAPTTYKTFSRTWPIKFRIEKNPVIRVRVLHDAGKGASQIANAIRLEFGICGGDLVQLLVNDLDPFSQQEAALAVAGVCQNADIPATTKVAETATQNALTSFDTTTGRLTFSGSTATLNSLKGGDVLVSEPSAAAPNGYLRKVTTITKNKKTGVVTVDTADALLNEAIHAGTLDAAGDLHASDVASTQALRGVTFTGGASPSTSAPNGLADVGDGFDFHDAIDVTLYGSAGDGDVSGNGTVHIKGEMKFNAGWNVGLGIEGCLKPPIFTCVDRFETHVGAHMYSNIKVDGTFNGHLKKDVILVTHVFKPIIIFIGPIPVVLVPVVNAIAGVHGDARVTFSFQATTTADLALGAKWTDPGDGGVGWANVSTLPTGTADGDADATATMEIHGYGAFDAKLLLYGILGPGLTGRAGLYSKVQLPGDPLWDLFGFANGQLTFKVSIGGVLDLGGYESDVQEARFHIKSAANQPPTCSGRTDAITVPPNHPVTIGPSSSGSDGGYFSCVDPEGGLLHGYVGIEGSTPVNLASQGWADGDHYVAVTVKDDHDQTSKPITLHFTVVDTPPILDVTTAGGHIRAGVQYFITASAWDVETGKSGDFLPCSAMTWVVTGGAATLAASNRTCTAAVIFSQTGTQAITVTATDPGGKTAQHIVTVAVGPPPANAAPVVTMDSFSITAATGPKVGCDDPNNIECLESCPIGFDCPVPMDSILYNGSVGPFHTPLTMSVEASDPDGSPLTVHWFCMVGAYTYAVTDNGDGTFSCDPYSSSITIPIYVWATVSDGTTTVQTELRRLFMLDRVV